MASDIRIPVLTGEYEKDKKQIEDYMREVNRYIRLLEEQLRKEIKENGR